MKNKIMVFSMLIMGGMLMAPSGALASDDGSKMSDVQHRKTMGGIHHPEDGDTADKEGKKPKMSDVQHRKSMGGIRHPEDGDTADKEGKKPKMSDVQHRKSMGGTRHPGNDE